MEKMTYDKIILIYQDRFSHTFILLKIGFLYLIATICYFITKNRNMQYDIIKVLCTKTILT